VNTPGYNANAKQRVIRMVEAQVDPMEPPSFKHKKVARGPPEAPVPVMHSPPRKVTVQDQQAWKIPPCVSNWKNAKGYTIPLDKRLAADGRGLQEVTINDNFASLAESLYIAERKAREEVKYRSTIQKKISQKEKEQQEAELRDLASKARLERQGISVGGGRDESRDTRDERDDDSGYWKVTTLVNSFANRSAFVVFSEPKIVTRMMAQKPGRIETSKRKEINCGWIANANASGRYVCAI
jgi:SNW domain-containing protein 1